MQYVQDLMFLKGINEENVYADFFDSGVYNEQPQQNYFFEGQTIYLALHTDGFAPFNSGTRTMTVIMLTILNLPPQER